MSSDNRITLGCCGGIVLLGIGIAAVFVINHNNDVNDYKKGHQAYQQFDCAQAINYYDKALNTSNWFKYGDTYSLAGPEKLECAAYLEGENKQQAKDFSGALLAFNSFITNNAASPLVEVARNNVEAIINENEPTNFVNDELCKQIDQLVINDLVPQPDANLPRVYFACGQQYEKTGIYWEAIDYYEQFLSGYPDHPLTPEVKSALLRSIVANAKMDGAGNLPAPERSGATDDGSTVVIIRNESPERLRIAFSGAESRLEELDACSTCSTYSTSPMVCPEIGPVGRYTITPGQYFVVVESTSDTETTPWKGDWTLDQGGEYTNCFFIIKRFVP